VISSLRPPNRQTQTVKSFIEKALVPQSQRSGLLSNGYAIVPWTGSGIATGAPADSGPGE
jgi:hypothetical protein